MSVLKMPLSFSSRSRTRVQATDDLTKHVFDDLSQAATTYDRQVGGTGLEPPALQSGSCMPWEAKSASALSEKAAHLGQDASWPHGCAARDQNHFHIWYTKSFFDSPLVEVTKSTGL
jgi:hypothetical protein